MRAGVQSPVIVRREMHATVPDVDAYELNRVCPMFNDSPAGGSDFDFTVDVNERRRTGCPYLQVGQER